MGNICDKTNNSSSSTYSDLSSSPLPFSGDCSPFLNWNEEQLATVAEEIAVVRSLVATVMFHPALDVSLEAKAVKLLKSVVPSDEYSAEALLIIFPSNSDDSLTDFVQSIVVLLSSPSQTIIAAIMEMLERQFIYCATSILLPLVKTELIPQVVVSLNPHSLSLADAVDIHICFKNIIWRALWLATPDGLEQPEIEEDDKQQAIYEIVLKQVLVPSER
ncbi:hypothetical protein BLNAU_18023 [Blattamonas nauphoetae]|uniref:Symplekin/Pta1 N-terminal domain-containing protein n=1 Tax=Blattamonas nauphoetae TaxID=2049346 RepID=A0ABQ9X9S4_9EUKA|nr:hypothetical protein BLNAU_18023 [Blattamonas nauphoetae]